MPLKLYVKYVSVVRDQVGKDQEVIVLEKEKATLRELLQLLYEKYRLEESPVEELLVLVNGKRLDPDEHLPDESQIIIAPPVSGG
ncbi:MAG: MoaD/ThiS family protein [Thermofilum sp.]|uniref:MoaD/ThiS family protein n=1 Tax=Thermofilum sp. TaxID=1961369 RepID=UPI003168A10A